MLKFYAINNELDIDAEFNKFIEQHIISIDTQQISCQWSGNSQYENVLGVLVDRFNFFIESGKITGLSTNGITEIKFDQDQYVEKTFDSHGNTISESLHTNNWDFRRYNILRYHLVQDLKDKLKNLDILDLDSLSIEYKVDKGFLIDFLYSLLSKDLIEISSEENKSLLKVKTNLEQILHVLDDSINEMELELTA